MSLHAQLFLTSLRFRRKVAGVSGRHVFLVEEGGDPQLIACADAVTAPLVAEAMNALFRLTETVVAEINTPASSAPDIDLPSCL
jgi:hypothetical protein